MTFSEVLLQKRKSHGLSQEELAEQLGISRQAVSKWETGEASPDLNKLLALSKALDISLDILCGVQDEAPSAESLPAAPAKRRVSHTLFLSALVLLIGVFIGGYFLGYSKAPQAVDVPDLPMELPETIRITGLNFSSEPDGVSYQFTPSYISPDCTYQITFTATGEPPIVCDAVLTGGVCTGRAVLNPWGGHHVTVSISNGETSRAISVAYNLGYHDSGCSWTPVN